jgi:capsular polysaccharide biosynthesis protein
MLFYMEIVICMIKFNNKYIVTTRTLPKNIKDKDLQLFEKELTKFIPKPKSRIVKNNFVTNYTIMQIFIPKFFIKQTFFEHPSLKKILKDTLKDILRSKKKVIKIDKASWILDNKSSVYFHFITDALSRALLIKNYTNEYPVLITPEFKDKPYLLEFLNYLNIEYIQMEENIYFIKELLITNHVAPSGNYNPEIIRELSASFTSKHTEVNNKKRRIWIDRKNERRDVINYDEFLKVIQKYNFEIIDFKKYSISQKNDILMDTECLMGVFGSGLTNMLMLPEKTKIIELRDKADSHNNAFFSLASELDLIYYYFEVEVLGHITHGDTKVNLNKFDSFLNTIFEKPVP